MRHSDRPIYRPDQDVFKRSAFASALANGIDKLAPAENGYVIAVNGEWGSGKSSVIELVLRYIFHIEMIRLSEESIPPDRDPKHINMSQVEAMACIYERIAGRINYLDNQNLNTDMWEPISRKNDFLHWLGSEDEADLADYYWRAKVRLKKSQRTIVLRFTPWLFSGRVELATALLSELGRTLGQRLGDDVRNAFGRVLARLAELAPLGGAGLDLASGFGIGRILTAGSPLLKKAADRLTAGPSLDELRSGLKQALSALVNRQVLVIVDDLDRLTPAEALEMISLVKGLGDLPNVIYLLSYEEKLLANLLRKALRMDGKEFLGKIVQYSVYLPIIDKDDLYNLLINDLKDEIGEMIANQRERFTFAWLYVIRQYLRTPRDVRRLVNNFSFAKSALAEQTDALDLLILEVLRLNDSQVYMWIRENLSELVG
jgi:predicted KAP-like P-loop ATPase